MSTYVPVELGYMAERASGESQPAIQTAHCWHLAGCCHTTSFTKHEAFVVFCTRAIGKQL